MSASRIASLRVLDLDAARAEVRAAMAKHKGSVPAAAAEFGCGPGWLRKWLDTDESLKGLPRRSGGRPRKAAGTKEG